MLLSATSAPNLVARAGDPTDRGADKTTSQLSTVLSRTAGGKSETARPVEAPLKTEKTVTLHSNQNGNQNGKIQNATPTGMILEAFVRASRGPQAPESLIDGKDRLVPPVPIRYVGAFMLQASEKGPAEIAPDPTVSDPDAPASGPDSAVSGQNDPHDDHHQTD